MKHKRIKALPEDAKNLIIDLVKMGNHPTGIADALRQQGHLIDSARVTAAQAVARWVEDLPPAAKIPDPVATIAAADLPDETVKAKIIKALSPHKKTYVEQVVAELDNDINELAEALDIYSKQKARAEKALTAESNMEDVLTDQARDALKLQFEFLKSILEMKQKLGILPLRPQQIAVSREATMQVTVGADKLLQSLIERGMAPDIINGESIMETKQRVRDGLITDVEPE